MREKNAKISFIYSSYLKKKKPQEDFVKEKTTYSHQSVIYAMEGPSVIHELNWMVTKPYFNSHFVLH